MLRSARNDAKRVKVIARNEAIHKTDIMKYTYRTQGTCSQAIEFEIVDGVVKNVQFYGGCSGNTQGVATLVEGMKAEDIIAKLEGIRCGFKSTSCPDQLAKAIKQALAQP